MSYELNAGGKQLAEVIEKVTWSGDSKQVAGSWYSRWPTRTATAFSRK